MDRYVVRISYMAIWNEPGMELGDSFTTEIRESISVEKSLPYIEDFINIDTADVELEYKKKEYGWKVYVNSIQVYSISEQIDIDSTKSFIGNVDIEKYKVFRPDNQFKYYYIKFIIDGKGKKSIVNGNVLAQMLNKPEKGLMAEIHKLEEEVSVDYNKENPFEWPFEIDKFMCIEDGQDISCNEVL